MSLAVKTILAGRRMKQRELADALDISTGYMSLLLSGERKPSHDLLTRMADVLGVPVGSLFEEAAEPQGFADPVEHWNAEPADLRLLNRMLETPAAQPDTYRIKKTTTGLGLMAGDLVIIDLGRTAKVGELVIGNEARDGTAQAFVARWADPWILFDENTPPRRIGADQATAIYGPVVGVLRGART